MKAADARRPDPGPRQGARARSGNQPTVQQTSARESSRPPDVARSDLSQALAEARRSPRARAAALGPLALRALQRSAGNSAVTALLAAKTRSPGEQAVTDIDAALKEMRRDEPVLDAVERGLKAAQAAGIPVELEGPKPPASALAVTKTGFGPGSVAGKKPVPAAKPVPPINPLGKVSAGKAKAVGAGSAATAGKAPAPPSSGGGAMAAPFPAPLSGDKLLQRPVAPAGLQPDDDPAFRQVTGSITAFAGQKKAHPPAASKAKEAQDAALAPPEDAAAQAKAAKADTMDAQQPGSFDKKAFIAAVKTAIEAKSPKTLKEADDATSSGKAGEVKGEVKGLVTSGKEGQTKDIETATEAPPDASKAVTKPVTPMAQEQAGQAAQIPAAGAVPKPAPAEQVNLAAGKHEANQEMAEAEVTDSQLTQSNEPEFQQGLADKKAAATHADTAPAEFRQQEQAVLQQGKSQAAAETTGAIAGMQGAKGAALAGLVADKGKTKSKDEIKRAEVTAKVQAIFTATEADVKKKLDGIDPKVEAAFEQGEAGAKAAFEGFVAGKMNAYKKDRYSGWLGGLRWAKDKLLGMPAKVDEFYEAGRELYLKQMDGVISRVADIVGNDLTDAKQRIARGKTEIASYVRSLPADLQKVGAEASQEIGEKFSQLESDVDAKQESVVDSLASKYAEARKGLDERVEALQAENKGLVDKAIGAIKAIVNTIRELAGMLKNVLSRAAGVVGDIIKNPIAFLGNLIAGVKGGILKFKDEILGHLRKGLMSWLFGALAEGGVEIPETFDLRSIVKLVASIFGLTWATIKNRIIKRIGAKAMDLAEKGVGVFQILASQGVAGLWQMLVDKLGDIKEMILSQVKDFVITKIITAGITWLIGLLNPAAAFIKACKLIYDVVMFFVNNGSRIMKFVNTIIDSVADIVQGNVGSVVNKINDVLGQMVPLIIGFLASAIGLGGIGAKIREILDTLQKPVTKAIDGVINTGLKLAGPLIRTVKNLGGKLKAKLRGGDDSPAGKQKRLMSGVRAGVTAANKLAGRAVGERMLRPLLGAVRVRYGLSVLEPVKQGKFWAVHGAIQRMTELSKVEVLNTAHIDEAYALQKDVSPVQDKSRRALDSAARKAPKAGGDKLATIKVLQARYAPLEKEFGEHKSALAAMRKSGKGDPNRLTAIRTRFPTLLTGFQEIHDSAKLATADPSEIQAQAKLVHGEIDGKLRKAEEILKKADVIANVLKNPVQADLATRIASRQQAIKDGLAALPSPVSTLADLQRLKDIMEIANGLQTDVTMADKIRILVVQVKREAGSIDRIIEQTTTGGRPGASRPDPLGEFEIGSSEAGARAEVFTGEQTMYRWHGDKCADDARGLTAAIENLSKLLGLPDAAVVRTEIDVAIAKATKRLPGLKSGAMVWGQRTMTHPAIWKSDGTLKKKAETT